jgi:hypothetical protein
MPPIAVIQGRSYRRARSARAPFSPAFSRDMAPDEAGSGNDAWLYRAAISGVCSRGRNLRSPLAAARTEHLRRASFVFHMGGGGCHLVQIAAAMGVSADPNRLLIVFIKNAGGVDSLRAGRQQPI